MNRTHALSFATFLTLSLLFPCSTYSQAWTQPAGNAYLKVAHGRTTVSEQFDLEGNTVPFLQGVEGNAFYDRSVYLYGEFGVSRGFTLVTMIPIKNIQVLLPDGDIPRTVGIANIELRGRFDLTRVIGATESPTAASLSFGVNLPTGYTRNLSPSVGSGQANLQFGIDLGRSFSPIPVYAQAGAGFVNRLSAFGLSRAIECLESTDVPCVEDSEPDFDNEWYYTAETGVTIGSRILLQGLLSGVRSVNAPDEKFNASNPIPTRRRFTKVGGGLTVTISQGVGLSLQTLRTVSGRNSIMSTELFFGVEYKISK